MPPCILGRRLSSPPADSRLSDALLGMGPVPFFPDCEDRQESRERLQAISQVHQGWTGDRRRFFHFGLMAGSSQLACREAGTADIANRILGSPVSRYGRRSQFEKASRHLRTTRTPESSSSRTPLADSRGILTPSSLHFERHHAGVPTIDPDEHRLLVHGMVERPLVFTVADLKRLPSVSRVCFVECAGNGGSECGAPDGPPTSSRATD